MDWNRYIGSFHLIAGIFNLLFKYGDHFNGKMAQIEKNGKNTTKCQFFHSKMEEETGSITFTCWFITTSNLLGPDYWREWRSLFSYLSLLGNVYVIFYFWSIHTKINRLYFCFCVYALRYVFNQFLLGFFIFQLCKIDSFVW